MFVRTLRNLETQDVGFRADDVLLVPIASERGYRPILSALIPQLLARVSSVPDVASASVAVGGTLSSIGGVRVQVDGAATKDRLAADWVGPDYMRTAGMTLLAGRDFSLADDERGQKVVIVNQTMARHYFGDGDALGRGLLFNKDEYTIVGVAKDAKYTDLRETTPPFVYFPTLQTQSGIGHLEIRTSERGAACAGGDVIRPLVHDVDPHLSAGTAMTLSDQIDRKLGREHLVADLASFFGMLTLALLSVGVYGTLAYAVGQRTKEIGVRLALGARRTGIVWMVLRQIVSVVAVGVIVGAAGVLLVGRLVKPLLFGLAPTDPWTIAGASILLVSIAVDRGRSSRSRGVTARSGDRVAGVTESTRAGISSARPRCPLPLHLAIRPVRFALVVESCSSIPRNLTARPLVYSITGSCPPVTPGGHNPCGFWNASVSATRRMECPVTRRPYLFLAILSSAVALLPQHAHAQATAQNAQATPVPPPSLSAESVRSNRHAHRVRSVVSAAERADYGLTAYTHDMPRGDNFKAGVNTGTFNASDNLIDQSFAYGLFDDLTIRASLGYGINNRDSTAATTGDVTTGNARGFSDPAIGATLRVLDEPQSPLILDLTTSYSPDAFSSQSSGGGHDGTIARGGQTAGLSFALGREMKSFTVAGTAAGTYVGQQMTELLSNSTSTESAAHWNYSLALTTQTRFTERVSLNAGVAFRPQRTTTCLTSTTGTSHTYAPPNTRTLNVALNYHFQPNRLVGAVTYAYNSFTTATNTFAKAASDTAVENRMGNVVGARLMYVFN